MAKFKVRARTVDMLGRQQIAGIPTAISELFKNAHDAYARVAEIDYFREEGLLVLRDDGLGMTLEDFEQRWLTLGTDSKVANSSLASPPIDPGQESRPILGEKGIGRLSIAILGPQVLVLTRAKRSGLAAADVTAAYLHWGLFELPSLNLEDIVIPVRAFKVDALPNANDIREMVAEAAGGLRNVSGALDSADVERLIAEMASFAIDPAALALELGSPQLSGDGCGTHFIYPAGRQINK